MRYNKKENNRRGRTRGFTVMEMIAYIALLGIISVFATNFLIQIVSTYQRARAEREVLSNARLVLETIEKSIATSQEAYAPTSRFNNDAGQLSLISNLSPQPEHTLTYIDMWIDNGSFMIRQEGGGATALSSPSVNVSQFRVERMFQSLGREAIKITVRVASLNPKFSISTTLHSTTALRGNY